MCVMCDVRGVLAGVYTCYRVPSGLPIKCGVFSLKMWEFNIALNPM